MADTHRSRAPRATESQAGAGPTNALAVPAFRLFWLNSLTFFMGSNALRFVYGWVVLDGLNKGEAWQGFVVFVLGIPNLILLMPAGVWADRFDPKRLLVASQAALLVTLIATAALLGDGAGTTTILVVSAVFAGVMTALGSPVRQAMIPQLLSGDLLYSGIGVNAIAMTLSLVFGAVTARLFGDWFGFDGAFWWLAALMALGIAAVVPMRSPGPANRGDQTSMLAAIGQGTRFVWNDRGMRTLFWLLSISGVLMAPMMFVTVQAHIKEEMGRSSADAAPFFALMGLGIALSSVYVMRRGNMADKGVKFMRAMVGGTSLITLVGRTTQYWQILVLALILGCCAGLFINMNQGLIQANTPAEVMGRVMGLYALVQVGLTPIGALGAGFLADAVGTGNALSLVGATALALVLITYATATQIRTIH